MARNKFDVDETLETPFNIKHLLRAGVYIGRHKKKMILSLLFSAISAACSLLGPMLIQRAIDVSVPNKDYTELVVLAIIMLVSIVASVLFARARSKYMIVVGQEIIYDIRKDLFEHLQKLPFQFYDDRPHGKILTRVINYVNSVSDALSNGIINFVLEIFNLILIAVFMFLCDVRLSLIVMAGIPPFLVIVLLIKPAQRRAWQDVSNKSSNINAYLHESLDGMKITQAFTREEENRGIYEKLNKKCYNTWMKAQYTSNLVWYSVDNISTWVVGAMYLIDAGPGYADRHPYCHFLLRLAVLAAHFEPVQPVQHLHQRRGLPGAHLRDDRRARHRGRRPRRHRAAAHYGPCHL